MKIELSNWVLAKLAVLVALIVAATVLECHDKEAAGLWFLIVAWIILGDWTE